MDASEKLPKADVGITSSVALNTPELIAGSLHETPYAVIDTCPSRPCVNLFQESR
ncbi:hypothetical protein PHOSAC3_1060001 [Mesotoga infera]|nr:hypothetical protein PHOSAC3_1060001 [Mesotoga infera]